MTKKWHKNAYSFCNVAQLAVLVELVTLFSFFFSSRGIPFRGGSSRLVHSVSSGLIYFFKVTLTQNMAYLQEVVQVDLLIL